jgi:thiol peroxidase
MRHVLVALLLTASGLAVAADLAERKGLVERKGAPLTLLGHPVAVGDRAPDATLIGTDMKPVRLASLWGRVVVIASVPSLDTPVCSVETRRFNQEATALGDDVTVAVVSMDLPFAQKRWCGAHGVKNVQTLSDHREAAFGQAYGVLLKGLRLLARAVFVIDRAGTVRYVEIVKELASEPDYDAALQAAKSIKKEGL